MTPALTPDGADRELFARCADGDAEARAELVVRFLPLARSLARRYERSSEPLEDLLQVASIGLIKAIDRFDLDRGLAFASFAIPTILGELRRHFRDHTWVVRVPQSLRETSGRVNSARSALVERSGREPTLAEIAAAVGVSQMQVSRTISPTLAYLHASATRRVSPAASASAAWSASGSAAA
jgi:RNA polymerase sigma-B factor